METLAMSLKERRRLETFSRVRAGSLTLRKASELLSLSYRQAKRVYARYRSEGDGGVVHGLRGRSSNHRADAQRRERILKLFQEKYHDFGPTLAEPLVSVDGVEPEAVVGEASGAGLRASGRYRGVVIPGSVVAWRGVAGTSSARANAGSRLEALEG